MAIAKYNGHEIDFSQDMVNLTQMWRACGSVNHKRPFKWISNDSTKELIDELQRLLKRPISAFYQTKRGRIGGGTLLAGNLALPMRSFLTPDSNCFAATC